MSRVAPYWLWIVCLLAVEAQADVTRVAILEFQGSSSGGRAMADAVELELELAEDMVLVPRKRIGSKLRRGRARFSQASVSGAMRKGNADVMLTGIGRRGRDGRVIKVTAYDKKGKVLFSEEFTLPAGEPDPDALAPMIAESLVEAVENMGSEPPPEDDYDDFDDLPPDEDDAPRARPKQRDDNREFSQRDRGSDEYEDRSSRGRRRLLDDDEDDGERRVSQRSGRRRSMLDDDDRGRDDRGRDDRGRGSDRRRIGDIDEGVEVDPEDFILVRPFVEVSAAFEPLYWSYDMKADIGSSQVGWSPTSPFAGGSLRGELWPIKYLGLDSQLRFGQVGVDLSGVEGINQRAIEIFFYEFQIHARGRYVLDVGLPGLAIGGRLGYRVLKADAAEQTPFMVVPGYECHMLSPGLDIRIPFHQQYAILDLSAELIPFASYSEMPDDPGQEDTASVFRTDEEGWGPSYRFDVRFHSVLYYGAFVEARFFWEEYYISYQGKGTREDVSQNKLSDGKVRTGLRGLSFGVGWTY